MLASITAAAFTVGAVGWSLRRRGLRGFGFRVSVLRLCVLRLSVKVATVEVKNVDLPQDMQRAMSKQAEAERERRAKVINAEGEFQAAAKLAEAAEVLSRFPIAVQLRYLQTMREVASERNTTTFFPLPLDLFASLLRAFSAAELP